MSTGKPLIVKMANSSAGNRHDVREKQMGFPTSDRTRPHARELTAAANGRADPHRVDHDPSFCVGTLADISCSPDRVVRFLADDLTVGHRSRSMNF